MENKRFLKVYKILIFSLLFPLTWILCFRYNSWELYLRDTKISQTVDYDASPPLCMPWLLITPLHRIQSSPYINTVVFFYIEGKILGGGYFIFLIIQVNQVSDPTQSNWLKNTGFRSIVSGSDLEIWVFVQRTRPYKGKNPKIIYFYFDLALYILVYMWNIF